MESNYHVIFDIAQVGFREGKISAYGLIATGLGIILSLLRVWRFKLFRNGQSVSYSYFPFRKWLWIKSG
jgi:hypothetical protein